MAEKVIMLGNEAIARGAYEAGVKVSSAYPGTPSTEISEYLVQYRDDVYEEWAPNEKVATEVAVGASLAGVRAMACMTVLSALPTSMAFGKHWTNMQRSHYHESAFFH